MSYHDKLKIKQTIDCNHTKIDNYSSIDNSYNRKILNYNNELV